MPNCTGTMKVWVMRSRCTVARKPAASNAGITTQVPPVNSAGSITSQVPLEYSAVVVSARLCSVMPSSIALLKAQCVRARCVCTMPLGSPVVPEL